MKKIAINLAEKYPIYIEKGLLQSSLLIDFCSKQANTIVIIADSNLSNSYAKSLLDLFQKENIKPHLLTFIASEKNKTRASKQQLEDKMFSLGCGRDTCLIALGGGITTDVVGFIAATYCRGIPVVYVPTTLLAMVDASIGGKTAVNTPYGKNLIGAFYQPKAVLIDIDTLKTLPLPELKNGMVEVIKHAVIKDVQYFHFLEKNFTAIEKCDSEILEKTVTVSCQIKKHIVEQDEKDRGIRQLLNFGHTIGHALEKVSNYQLSHGEAVALGMIAESYISMRLGFLSQDSFKKIKAIFEKYQIPLTLPGKYAKRDIKNALLLDKKAIGQRPYFVLLDDIGQTHTSETGYTMPVPEEIIDRSLKVLC